MRRALSGAGLRGYRLHRRDVPGCPDIAWIGRRVAVFVDGAFWHGHPSAYRNGQSGPFWDVKIANNMKRDAQVNETLQQAGWTVIRFWDFEIDDSIDQCVEAVSAALDATAMAS